LITAKFSQTFSLYFNFADLH